MALPAVLGGGLLEEVVAVEVDEVVVVVDFLESEAAGTDVGDGGGSEVELELEGTEVGDGRGAQTAGANIGCWVLWGMNETTYLPTRGRRSWPPGVALVGSGFVCGPGLCLPDGGGMRSVAPRPLCGPP